MKNQKRNNKIYGKLVYFVILIPLLMFLGCQWKNPTLFFQNNNGSESIQIAVDKGLKEDLRFRLEKLEKESLLPFAIEENPPEKTIIITFEENKIPQEWEKTEIFKKEVQLKPESFQANFKDKIDQEIILYYASKDKNSIVIKDYLIDSYSQNPPEIINLTFVGDVMLARYVDVKSRQQNNYQCPFLETAEELKQADLTIGNLESPFSETGPYLTSGMTFRTRPEMIEGLKLAGFDILNLANNHFGDSGKAGMEYTFKYLQDNQIDYFAAGENFDKSHQALIKQVKGIKFAFLGYTEQNLIPYSYQVSENQPGVNIINLEQMKEDVKKAKEQADYVIISLHAGTEYQNLPNHRQKEFNHAAIEAGADFIYGHHPHVIQGLEIYQQKPIFYSLGNFVFDQTINKTKDGLTINLGFIYNKLVSIELEPIKIRNLSQPYFPSQSLQESILQSFYKYSNGL